MLTSMLLVVMMVLVMMEMVGFMGWMDLFVVCCR